MQSIKLLIFLVLLFLPLQAHAGIWEFGTGGLTTVKDDPTPSLGGDLNATSHLITDLSDPISAQDAVTLTYGNAHWGAGNGTIGYLGTPVANDFARFVSINTVEGRSYSEVYSDLGLSTAALRAAEDTMTDGSNLPDGHAIKVYGDANWSTTTWTQATGYDAGHSLTSGTYNCLAGYAAGYSQTTGSFNTSVGYDAGYSQDVGRSNTSIGFYAGYSNYQHAGRTSVNGYGDYSVYVGAHAGQLSYGGFNTFVGMEAGAYIQWGYDNTFIGLCAGRFTGMVQGDAPPAESVITNKYNTFLGSNTGIMQDGGGWNTYLGTSAGYGSFGGADPENPSPPQGTGSYNTYVGGEAARHTKAGSYNTVVGYQAAYYMTDATYNTYVGRAAGLNTTTGSSNVAIGSASGLSITTLSNAVCIGTNSDVTVANGFVLGGASTNVGIRKNNPSHPLDVVGDIYATGNIVGGYNISVPTNRSLMLEGISGDTGFYFDGTYVRLVKNGAVVATW